MNTASCGICKDAYTQSSTLCATPCGHIFHQDCISRCMVSSSSVCPICRKTLSRERLVRLYFDFDGNQSNLNHCAEASVIELQQALTDLRSQLSLSESRCVAAEQEVSKCIHRLQTECAIAASLRDQLDDLRTSEHLLRVEFEQSQEHLICVLATFDEIM